MSIAISEASELKGFTLLWNTNKTQKMIGERKYLHVEEGYSPDKNVRDCKVGMMKNKDPKVIKLRDKLFQEEIEEVLPVMEALSNPELTLDEFTELYSKEVEEHEEGEIIEYGPESPEGMEIVDIEDIEGKMWEDENLFGESSAKEEVAATTDVKTDYIGDINIEDLPKIKHNQYDEEVEESDQPDSPQMVEVDLEPLKSEVSQLREDINSISQGMARLSNIPISMEKYHENLPEIESILLDFKKEFRQEIDSIKLNKESFDKKYLKPISQEEREVIENYSPPNELKQFLKSGNAVRKYNEGIISYKGLEIMEGSEVVIEQGSEGLYEFICKYFPFIISEYKNQIMNKIGEGK